MLQLLGILTFCKYYPSNLRREAILVTPEIIMVLKVIKFDMKALHIAFLGSLGCIL